MEVLLKDFCLKTSLFLEEEAEKIRREGLPFGTSPSGMDYQSFKKAHEALANLASVLAKADSPHHDLKIHLGNVFGFSVKEESN